MNTNSELIGGLLMINTYSNLIDGNGEQDMSRTKLFIREYDIDGNIVRFQSGLYFTPEESGILFIIDKWLLDQIDKVKFSDGVLSVKEGEELMPPVKSEKELKREALLKQLAELESEDTQEEEVT